MLLLLDTCNAFDRTLWDQITEVQNVFNQMEAAVDQCFVDKNAFKIQIKQLSIDNDQLLKQIMSQEIMHISVNYVDSLDVKKSCVNECNKCLELETGLLKKKDLIEKDVYDKLLKITKKDTVIRKLKDKIKSLSGKDGVENVKKDIDEIKTINIELEHRTALGTTGNHSEPLLEFACIFTKYVQELLVYVSQTCPNSPKPSEKLVVVTFMNKDKRVSHAPVKHSVRNAKFESICAICNKCLFDSNHDMCIIDYVNVRSKSKFKRNKMRKEWKPTGKVFSEIGYSWKPTGRTFTIVVNRFPLTRITSTKVVPTKKTSTKSIATPTQGILVYSKRRKATRSVGSSSKVKIVESKIYKSKEPKQSWGSTVSDVPSC
ncbi:hypothetical protein Tco_0767048 [Tanacetum coccineum]